jgi:hypothetical protein
MLVVILVVFKIIRMLDILTMFMTQVTPTHGRGRMHRTMLGIAHGLLATTM